MLQPVCCMQGVDYVAIDEQSQRLLSYSYSPTQLRRLSVPLAAIKANESMVLTTDMRDACIYVLSRRVIDKIVSTESMSSIKVRSAFVKTKASTAFVCCAPRELYMIAHGRDNTCVVHETNCLCLACCLPQALNGIVGAFHSECRCTGCRLTRCPRLSTSNGHLTQTLPHANPMKVDCENQLLCQIRCSLQCKSKLRHTSHS